MKRKTKAQKGITLVALIITIIVLLILAVVAIRAVQGDGIIAHAKNARSEYEKAAEKENALLSNLAGYITTTTQGGANNAGTNPSEPVTNCTYKAIRYPDCPVYIEVKSDGTANWCEASDSYAYSYIENSAEKTITLMDGEEEAVKFNYTTIDSNNIIYNIEDNDDITIFTSNGMEGIENLGNAIYTCTEESGETWTLTFNQYEYAFSNSQDSSKNTGGKYIIFLGKIYQLSRNKAVHSIFNITFNEDGSIDVQEKGNLGSR